MELRAIAMDATPPFLNRRFKPTHQLLAWTVNFILIGCIVFYTYYVFNPTVPVPKSHSVGTWVAPALNSLPSPLRIFLLIGLIVSFVYLLFYLTKKQLNKGIVVVSDTTVSGFDWKADRKPVYYKDIRSIRSYERYIKIVGRDGNCVIPTWTFGLSKEEYRSLNEWLCSIAEQNRKISH